MKSSFILLSFFYAFVLNAQIPNNSFETWETIGSGMNSYQEPISWNTLNGDLATYFVSADATKVSDSHTGVSAAKLETKSVAGINTPAVLTIGTIYATGTFDRDIRGGIAYTQKPQVFEGWYKFSPQGNDIGYIACILFKHNYITNKQDTVGAAIFKPTATTSQYTKFSINFNYNNYMPNETPDSMNVIITSSFKFTVTSANIGTILTVDDLKIDPTSTIDNIESTQYKMYYSPENYIIIKRNSYENVNILITSIFGETILNNKYNEDLIKIDAQLFSKGIYIVTAYSETEKVTQKICVY